MENRPAPALRAAQPDYLLCPHCRSVMAPIPGWQEYGDQLVEITRIGCWICGYYEQTDEDATEDEWNLI